MTAKEKANELVNKYKSNARFRVVGQYKNALYHAKQCALICVDEMIEISYPVELLQKSWLVFITEYTTEYLEDVKTEINKL